MATQVAKIVAGSWLVNVISNPYLHHATFFLVFCLQRLRLAAFRWTQSKSRSSLVTSTRISNGRCVVPRSYDIVCVYIRVRVSLTP